MSPRAVANAMSQIAGRRVAPYGAWASPFPIERLTDRVVFLSDGRIVDELRDPEREQIIAWMAAAEPAD